MNELLTLAVVGHPNEGKSSVVSTLAEDDQVPVSPVPGETRRCHAYTVFVEEQPVLRFVDTPGFQRPRRALRWFQAFAAGEANPAAAFIAAHAGQNEFAEECELLRPLAEGAGLLYVVDASRPIRPDDEAEMEILRLTGRPRMAILNAKSDAPDYRAEWKAAFARSFNSTWAFNAYRATFAERIALLEALRHIEQSWGDPLARVIGALRRDWDERLGRCAEAILDGVEEVVRVRVAHTLAEGVSGSLAEERVQEEYQRRIERVELDCHRRLRLEFKHNLFDPEPDERLRHGLFAAETWKLLGLTRKQFAKACAAMGAALGAAADVAAAGIAFGVFTALGAAAGYIVGRYAFDPLAALKVKTPLLDIPFGRREVSLGPNANPQLVSVFVDRALIYARQSANWAHARREAAAPGGEGKAGLVSAWPENWRDSVLRYHKALLRGGHEELRHRREALRDVLVEALCADHSQPARP